MAHLGGRVDEFLAEKHAENDREEAGGQGESMIALFERLTTAVPEEELRTIPADLSTNLDHYLYAEPDRH